MIELAFDMLADTQLRKQMIKRLSISETVELNYFSTELTLGDRIPR